MVTQPRWLRALALAAATTLVTSTIALAVVQPAEADSQPVSSSTPTTATTTALPTVQVDGVVWAQIVIGNTVYVGGNFTKAQPAGAAAGVGSVARSNMLAYNLTTGVLIDSFAPTFNGQIRGLAASPDGKRIYAVGSFTTVSGVGKNRLVALDASTGAVVTAFKPTVNAQVLSVATSGNSVYFGGSFTSVDSVDRTRAAAVSAGDGSILPWAPAVPDHDVRALVVSPDGGKVVLAGSFLSLNGSTTPGRGSGMVDASTGTTNLPWALAGVVYDAGDKSAIWSLSTDGTNIYGTGYVYGGLSDGNLEGTFNASWDGGKVNWIEDCHGDSYGASAMAGAVYVVGHAHECITVNGYPQTTPDWTYQRGLAFSTAATGTLTHNIYAGPYADWAGTPAPTLLTWYPDLVAGTFTGQGQAAWTVTTSGGYVLMGGEFPTVNGKRQTGLVRFATSAVSPDTDGPQLANAKLVPNVVSDSSGTASLSWRADYDRDNENLTYEVYRNGNKTTPVYSTTANSRIWYDRPTVAFTDTGLTPGSSYSYRLKVTDPAGNSVWGDAVSVTVAGSNTPISSYDSAVVADGAQNYWRLSDPAGSATAFDSAGADNLAPQGGVTFGAAGSLMSSPSATAATFSGTSTGFASTQTIERGPQTFSVEAWFRTTSTTGGKIVGFGDNKGTAKVATSSNDDRHIFMDASGAVSFGVYDGNTETISTGSGLNDGKWHYAVGTLSSTGMQFFVDGVRIGTRSTTSAQDYYGYWRVGGDTSWSGDQWFDGDIDDVAVYPIAVSTAVIKRHWSLSGDSVAAATPTDAYGAAVSADYPDSYWRLDDTAGSSASDASGNGRTATYSGGVTQGAPGGVNGTTDTAATFDGSSGLVVADEAVTDPEVYSLELWFNTTTTSGGKLIGFGDARSGRSSNYDRHVWMRDDGTLVFGTWTGRTNTITTTKSYNDGAWHHIVASQGSEGLQLYVDGVLAGTNPTTQAQSYTGYWRIGGDTAWGGDTSDYFAGRIDEVAIYSDVLTASQVASHYAIGSGRTDQPPVASFSSSVDHLKASFDATASSDPDGTIASYAWNFGDQSTAAGATPDHTYALAGTFQVSLTVTDDGGASTTTTQTVTVVAPNRPPVASFTSSTTGLTVSVDASGSSDPDGSVTSYAWDFGDGTTAAGVTAAHTYSSKGVYTVTLTVTDDGRATTSTTRTATVAAMNVAPAASFTVTASDLQVAFDGTASADSDGTVASYTWDFGDGTTGTGPTTTHTYSSGGTYTVRLTVTDDQGATGSTTRSTVVTAPAAPSTFATDGFGRSVTSGLGSADQGGAWTVSGSASAYSVDGSRALLATAAGKTLTALLNGVTRTDADVRASYGVSALPSAGSAYLTLIGRQVGTTAYAARVTLSSAGVVNLYLMNGGSSLQSVKVAGLAVTPGDRFQVRLQVASTSPTTLRAKVWKAGTAEPTAWQVTATDSTSAMQAAGSVGVGSYVSASATNAPIVVSTDDFAAAKSAGAANVAPAAAFSASVSDLAVALDGSASSDTDGSIVSSVWDFGDGTTGSGLRTSHTFATAGSYPVRLTVTDDQGATGTATRSVTVSAPAASAALANDAFTRTVTAGLGTADQGGAWTTTGGASAFSVNGNQAVLATGTGKTLTAVLGSVTSSSSDVRATFSPEALPTAGSAYLTAVGRQVGSASYAARTTVSSTGAVSLYLLNGGTSLMSTRIAGLTVSAGDSLRVRLQVDGTAPTTIRAKVWKSSASEPADWQLTATDSTSALQTAGSVGFGSYLSSSATGTLTIVVDDFTVVRP